MILSSDIGKWLGVFRFSLHPSLFQLHYDSSFVFEMLTTTSKAHPTSTSENAKFNNPLGTAIVLYFLA